MGSPSRIESVAGVGRALAGPSSAAGRAVAVSRLEEVRSLGAVWQGDAPWVVYADGCAEGLLEDLRASSLIPPGKRAVVLQNGDFSELSGGAFSRSPVVLARPDLDRPELMESWCELVEQGRHVWVLSPTLAVLRGRAPVKEVRGMPLARLARPKSMRVQRFLKRCVDVVGAAACIVLLSPLLLFISAAVKITSPGPVLFKQKRMGKDGKPFVCYKFRSMTADSDPTIHMKYWEGLRQKGQEAGLDKSGNRVYKLVDDPRVTRLGRVLRRWSLDELPQLFNVLAGHMSLVGPRPCLPYEWKTYEEWHKRRLSVQAGITGLWQVTGRSNVNFDEMVLLDLYYAANWSLWMDFKILLRTIPAVFNGEGAH